MTKALVIAIDGPAASGKGTLARKLADHYQLPHLDTGKLYRIVGKKLLQATSNINQAEDHESETAQKAILIAELLDTNDVMNARHLSSEEVGRAASIVSAIPQVRSALLKFQRDFAAQDKGAVLDGRDIGTVICPGATHKFFITASVEVRAERRYKQLHQTDKTVTKASVLQDLQARDQRDMQRSEAPLLQAQDAVHIDTSEMDMDDVLNQVVSIISASTS